MYDEKEIVLLHAAIHAVARDGLEKTTTRSIGATARINDAYIYRYFRDKEDLLSRAYIYLNEQIVAQVVKSVREIREDPSVGAESGFAAVIHDLWELLIEYPDACIFCNYYYHSASYKKYVGAQHHALVARLLDVLGEFCILNEEAETAMYYMMESIIGLASRVIDGFIPDGEQCCSMAVARLHPVFRSVASPK